MVLPNLYLAHVTVMEYQSVVCIGLPLCKLEFKILCLKLVFSLLS